MTITLRLDSQPAEDPPPAQTARLEACLQAINRQVSVVPGWRDNQVVPLPETAPNVFEQQFFDVPAGRPMSMTVRDPNQCRRDPTSGGAVLTGVAVNGVAVQRVISGSRILTFIVSTDGAVTSPPADDTAP